VVVSVLTATFLMTVIQEFKAARAHGDRASVARME
jgi:hypothetical protein